MVGDALSSRLSSLDSPPSIHLARIKLLGSGFTGIPVLAGDW